MGCFGIALVAWWEAWTSAPIHPTTTFEQNDLDSGRNIESNSAALPTPPKLMMSKIRKLMPRADHVRFLQCSCLQTRDLGKVVFVSLMLIYGRLWNGSTTATSIGAKWCLLRERIVSSCRRAVAAMAISAKPGE